MSVLTVLRNRAYVGEVFFRDAYHRAPHEALVDVGLFEAAQGILAERGEDYSRRASNASEYLLSGVVVCSRCGRHYTGTAARGRSARYHYYTCFTRQRYGTRRCDADRLPATALENAVLAALQRTYERRDLLEQALASQQEAAEKDRPRYEEQLGQVDDEIQKAEEAIERYLLAFEAKTLPEGTCGERVRQLAGKVAQLRQRRADLVDDLEAAGPNPDELYVDAEAIRAALDELVRAGDLSTSKALLQQLGRRSPHRQQEAIFPVFRVPVVPVRAVSGQWA